jgi:hypothetical protein
MILNQYPKTKQSENKQEHIANKQPSPNGRILFFGLGACIPLVLYFYFNFFFFLKNKHTHCMEGRLRPFSLWELTQHRQDYNAELDPEYKVVSMEKKKY